MDLEELQNFPEINEKKNTKSKKKNKSGGFQSFGMYFDHRMTHHR
jgi:hypothetical protein